MGITDTQEGDRVPEIGEIKLGLEIGQVQRSNYFVWQACGNCGKERWVRIIKDQAKCKLCKSCALRIVQTNNKGKGNGRWNGGRRITHYGYIEIWIPDDDFFAPMKTAQGYVREHRLIVAKALGRCLHRWEIVHHKGVKYPKGSIENKQDNRYPENLQLVSDLGHKQITILENRIKRLETKVQEQEKQIKLLQWQFKDRKDAILS